MKKHLQLAYTFRKLNIQGAMAYRVSFLAAVISMLINDVVMIMVFYMFFQKFGTIGGLDFQGYLKLDIVVIAVYSFMTIPFYGSRKIADKIVNGQLDSDMLLPKDLLLRLITNGISMSAYGDLLFGIIALFFIDGLTGLFLIKLLFVGFFGGLTFTGFMLIFESLGFWIGSSRELTQAIFNVMLGPSMYPEKIFEGSFFALLFKTVLPVFFVIYLPYNILTLDFSLINTIILVSASVFFFGVGYILFYKGLKRYESGNAININM